MSRLEPPIIDAYRSEDGVHLVFYCQACWRNHYHGSGGPEKPFGFGNGHRVAHCHNPDSSYGDTGYILREVAGAVPPEPVPPPPLPGSFYEWLTQQTERNDAVGDVARDACADAQDWGWTDHTIKGLRTRMEELGAIDRAFDALDIAVAEWSVS